MEKICGSEISGSNNDSIAKTKALNQCQGDLWGTTCNWGLQWLEAQGGRTGTHSRRMEAQGGGRGPTQGVWRPRGGWGEVIPGGPVSTALARGLDAWA